MTEIYHGPWSPTKGDTKEVTVPNDSYHPRYPAVNGENYYYMVAKRPVVTKVSPLKEIETIVSA